MRRLIMTVLAILLVLAVGFGGGMWLGPRFKKDVEPDQYSQDPRPDIPRFPIGALGKIQPAGGVISVTATPGDRIAELFVRQGRRVEKGAKLVEMASLIDRRYELDLAKARLDEAEKRVAKLEASHEHSTTGFAQKAKDIEEAFKEKFRLESARVAAAQDKERNQQSQLDRILSLDPSLVNISAQERQNAQLALTLAASELKAALIGRDSAGTEAQRQRHELKRASQSAEDEYQLSVASIPRESLRWQKRLAEQQLTRSEINSPVAGTVLKVFSDVGDSVGNGPILQIAVDQKMVVIAEVDARRVRPLRDAVLKGQAVPVEVTSPVFDGKLKGELTDTNAISYGVARNALVGFNPRADTDRRVIEVRVELDPASSETAKAFIGLEVNVDFQAPEAAKAARRQP